MVNTEKLLGFDAREMWCQPGAAWVGKKLEVNYWDGFHKDNYLLRSDVQRPLSTDYLVWPSVFDLQQRDFPYHNGFIQDLWSNLEELLTALQDYRNIISKPYRIVGFTLRWDLCNHTEREMWTSIIQPTEPAIIQPTWQFLGYDTSDRWLLSSLSNCFNPRGFPDFAKIKKEWRPYLNNFHLFDDLNKANEFAKFADKKVDDHAPFFVYGLWSIKAVEK